ncbi:C40 family peptidase [Blastococcus sp. TF02A-26]|uniref:C40 family peptidase n=1 Tax=Blastococcus sp. TF02A-26 TaxID=2250577 RepID=UPI000DE8081D|nr:C40 family peptidase [Blastococcus sp. TF02A-26]RBY90848.1 NlpC/P60 family protein [Blastococcus sp. TF02A-26]
MARSHVPGRLSVPGSRALLVAVAASGLALAPLPAAAAPEDPTPTTSQEAAELLSARAHDLEVVTEEFNEARERLAAAQAAATGAADAVAAAETALADSRDRVREVARSAWTGDRLGSAEAMLTSGSADELLDRVATLEVIADHNAGLLDDAVAADEAAAATRDQAEDSAAQAQSLYDDVAAQQADLQEEIAAFQAEYERLAAEEEAARLAAERAAAEAAARAAAEQAAAQAAAEAAEQTTGPAPAPAPAARPPAPAPAPRPAAPAPVSVRAPGPAAQVAVDTALAQRGDPYVWAAAGPDAFDCSGLTSFAYRAAGISLPHSSRMQSQMGTPVSRADLQPGDLVFFYSPVSHVGMYIGNGQMVHASTYGQPVQIASVDSMGGYNSARRIA